MQIRPIYFASVLLILGSLFSGCEQRHSTYSNSKSSADGTVALIDLDEVAKRLGRDVVILSELKTETESLTAKLTSAQTDFQNQFNQTKESIGATPSDSDKQKLLQLEKTLNLEFQKKQQEAQNEMNTKRSALVIRFREEVKPIALEVANDRGLEIVLIKSDALVLAAQPAVDITDAVVAKMINSPSARAVKTPEALPTLTPTKQP